jgi:hypothetical protein
MRNIKEHLSEPSAPWKRGPFIGGAGLLAGGWTPESKVFMLFPDYYAVRNPITGENERICEEGDVLNYLSKDNLEYQLKGSDQKIKVFGLRGGNGNHLTSDRWQLNEILQDSQEKIFGITNLRKVGRSSQTFWKNYKLIQLNNLEFGEWCGFSPDEKNFGIFGSGGVELFYRK